MIRSIFIPMNKKAWVFVIVQFACIVFLILKLPLFKPSFLLIFQLIALLLGFWAVFESRKGRFSIFPDVQANSTLIQSGPYRLIRHPMYSSLILFFAALLLKSPSLETLIVYLILLFDLLLKLNYEEKQLLKAYPDYERYKKNTYRIVPFIY